MDLCDGIGLDKNLYLRKIAAWFIDHKEVVLLEFGWDSVFDFDSAEVFH